jgi:holliday junction DNA helicase RuvB
VAAALGDERDVIEEVVEPYLIQAGFVQRTSRGRLLTHAAFRHLDLPLPTPGTPALAGGHPGASQLDLLSQLRLEPGVEPAP